ncbi:MAG: hypothetical protein LDLANPLL_00487 [Turneriella sp.]|nr:hypothetical protein [Turneriella sp.]
MRRWIFRNEQTHLPRIVSENKVISDTLWSEKDALNYKVTQFDATDDCIRVQLDGKDQKAYFHITTEGIDVVVDGFFYRFTKETFRGAANSDARQTELRAEIPGRIVKVLVRAGDTVEAGTPLLIQEAMKMELTLAAPFRVKIQEVLVEESAQVDADAQLIRFEAANGV